jgi:hypothetical protein
MHSEPRFLDGGVLRTTATLARDFVNFVLVLVFYALCWTVGSAAFMLDNMFHTGLYERFIRLVERIDDGGR